MFSTLTERNNILLTTQNTDPHFWQVLFERFLLCVTHFYHKSKESNSNRMFCYWYLFFIRIRPWNNSIWLPGTYLWSSKTEICHESNKAEIKEKLQSFKMSSTERILPPGTDWFIKSLEHLPKNLNLRSIFEAHVSQ